MDICFCNTLCRFVIEYIYCCRRRRCHFPGRKLACAVPELPNFAGRGGKKKKKKATTVRLTASSSPSQLVAHSTSFFFPFGLPARLFHLARPFLLNPTSTSSYLSHFGSRRSSSRHAPGHPVAFNERIKRPDSDQRIITNGATSNGTPRLLSIPPKCDDTRRADKRCDRCQDRPVCRLLPDRLSLSPAQPPPPPPQHTKAHTYLIPSYHSHPNSAHFEPLSSNIIRACDIRFEHTIRRERERERKKRRGGGALDRCSAHG